MAQKLGSVVAGTVVKTNESGSPVEFVVIHQGSPSNAYVGFENATWLRRKDIYSNGVFGGSSYNYAGSSVHTWMNDEKSGYLGRLDHDILAHVATVKIPYLVARRTVKSGNDGLECKAFILSTDELNLGSLTGVEIGVPLPYFKNGGNANRIAKFNGVADEYWTRTPHDGDDYCNYFVTPSGGYDGGDNGHVNFSFGYLPVLPMDSDLYVDDSGNLIVNQPPTAPASIDVSGVVHGGTATVTLTAATDPDGSIASYVYERQVDGGAWQQVTQANSLTQTDAVGEDWGTVAYRAAAVDNLGLQGPYITGETFTVNSGWTIISGPAEAMGSKAAPFDFAFSASVSGQSSTGAITVRAALDGEQVYSGTPSAGAQVTIPIKTHLLGAGTHVIEVQASKDDYLPASKRYTFTVPAVAIPEGGVGALAQGPDGRAVYHTTLAQRCIGTGGVDIQAQVDALTARVKTLEG